MARWSSTQCIPLVLGDARLDLDDLVELTRPGASNVDGNAVLRALVDVSQRGDDPDAELAGRVVLQRMLPGLIAGSRRWRSAHGDDPADVAIGAAWEAIARFETAVRRGPVAPMLVHDAIWIGFRRATRRRAAGETPVEPGAFRWQTAPTSGLDPVSAIAATLRAARSAGVDEHHLDIIRDLADAGSTVELATRRRVTDRTIRNHRAAAAAAIAGALGTEWGDGTDPLCAVA